ncbi:MAG: MmgE/PrpD family protein, partial [Deltaproteobacteria bacterium]|nr:MmgE/PrpD family protein [Deltaproteobacteria bacterium]
MQASEKIAAFVTATTEADIPDTALRQAKVGITDWLFVALAGKVQGGEALQGLCGEVIGRSARMQGTLIGQPS